MYIPEDQTDLLSTFNQYKVDYLLVGGHAVNAYTQARSTKDLDIWIANDSENAKRTFRALVVFGASLMGHTFDLFHNKPNTIFQIGIDPDRIDILQSLPGLDYETASKDAVETKLAGVRVLSLDHLIQNKTASGRPRDLGDVDELRKFNKI